MDKEELMQTAITARKNAYVPYSHFAVGAAVISADGRVFSGANIENASYGITMCAERNAIFAAACAGVREISALAVVADTDGGVAPCGACRQAMTEFMGAQTPVYLGNLHGTIDTTTVTELLPGAFNKEDMHNA
ncbi:cytidine deaminase [Lacticaseibacillus zhaodongensis]|uniref:cytidine deaminase n=1 Tax=Lacticaseibacillus zhaodongensis TaxID=2668065 RepID=UPI0012D30E7B|nr:cytidine deaminase [Lacticaseibacillus zhaodongensis]